MSMFGLIFADPTRQERMGMLLAVLAFNCETPEEAEAFCTPIMDLRLRDMWVEKSPDGPPVLAVYTRNGGGNRECFCEAEGTCTGCKGDLATEHPLYLTDADDDFDSTYRTYWFSFPADLRRDLREALTEAAEEPRNMSERWLDAIDAIGKEV